MKNTKKNSNILFKKKLESNTKGIKKYNFSVSYINKKKLKSLDSYKILKKDKENSLFLQRLKNEKKINKREKFDLYFFLQCFKKQFFKRFGFNISKTIFIKNKKPYYYFSFKRNNNKINFSNLRTKNYSFKNIFSQILKNKKKFLICKKKNSKIIR